MPELPIYTCPECHETYPLEDRHLVGQSVDCAGCGKSFIVAVGEAPTAVAPARTSALALSSLVVGSAGLFLAICLAPLGMMMGLAALVLGLIAFRSMRRYPALRGKGLAIAGVSLGSVDLLGGSLVMAVFLPAFFSGIENGKIARCSNNQSRLMVAYKHSITHNPKEASLQDARGHAFWVQIVSISEPNLLNCPLSGQAYRGPAQNPNEMPETAAFSMCEHGEGKPVNILLKSGDMRKVPHGSAQHKRALEETVE